MRVHEGMYAYEVSRVFHYLTQLPAGWEFKIYQTRPDWRLLYVGQRKEKETAVREAQQVIDLLKYRQAA
jgi:hypothetical protein